MDSNKKPCLACKARGWIRKGYAVLHGQRIMHMTAYQPCKKCFGTGETYKNIYESNNLGSCAI